MCSGITSVTITEVASPVPNIDVLEILIKQNAHLINVIENELKRH